MWSTAGIRPAAPGVSPPHSLSLHTAPCRSHQTSAAPAATPPCQTPAGRRNKNTAGEDIYPSALAC